MYFLQKNAIKYKEVELFTFSIFEHLTALVNNRKNLKKWEFVLEKCAIFIFVLRIFSRKNIKYKEVELFDFLPFSNNRLFEIIFIFRFQQI